MAKPKFQAGQVVKLTVYKKSYVRILSTWCWLRTKPSLGHGCTFEAEYSPTGRDRTHEKNLRPLTARERGDSNGQT